MQKSLLAVSFAGYQAAAAGKRVPFFRLDLKENPRMTRYGTVGVADLASSQEIRFGETFQYTVGFDLIRIVHSKPIRQFQIYDVTLPA